MFPKEAENVVIPANVVVVVRCSFMAHVFHVNTNWPVGTLDDMHVWWRLMFSKLTISLDSARTEQCFLPIFNLLYLCICVYLYQGYTKIHKTKIVLIPQNIRALLCTHGIKVRDAKSTTTKKKKRVFSCSSAWTFASSRVQSPLDGCRLISPYPRH